jgi:hypothetical protein
MKVKLFDVKYSNGLLISVIYDTIAMNFRVSEEGTTDMVFKTMHDVFINIDEYVLCWGGDFDYQIIDEPVTDYKKGN